MPRVPLVAARRPAPRRRRVAAARSLARAARLLARRRGARRARRRAPRPARDRRDAPPRAHGRRRARAGRAALREARAAVLAAIRAVEAASRARDAALAEAKQAHDWRRRRGEPVGDDLEAATKAHADETAAEDAELERLGLRDAADRRWLRRYDDARAKPLAYWTSARDDRPLADALRAQGPAAYGAPLLAAYRNQKNRCAAMAAALAASRFPVTGCMVDRLLADFPSKPAAAQDAVAARLVDVPTTAVAADERAALAALAAGARRVRDLVAESGATELAERLDATYRAACAVEQPLDDAAATGSAGATVLALRRQALAEADAAAAAARGGEASGAAARACWLIDDGVLELALRAWRATTRLQTGARRASALRQHARRKARARRPAPSSGAAGAASSRGAWRRSCARSSARRGTCSTTTRRARSTSSTSSRARCRGRRPRAARRPTGPRSSTASRAAGCWPGRSSSGRSRSRSSSRARATAWPASSSRRRGAATPAPRRASSSCPPPGATATSTSASRASTRTTTGRPR